MSSGGIKELKSLNKYFFKYKWLFLGGVLFVSLSNYFAIYPASIVREAFDLIKSNLAQIKSGQDSNSLTTQITRFGLLILGMALLKGLFMFFMRQTIIVMSRKIEYDLKNEIFNKYQSLSASFYKRNNTGDLMNRISEDVSRVRMYVGPAIMYIVNLATMILLVVITMLNVNTKLTLFVMLPLPILSYLIYKVSATINKKSERVQSKLSLLSTFVQESFSGIRIVKAFAIEKKWQENFTKESDAYKDTALELARTDAKFTPSVAAIVGLSTIMIVFVGGSEALAGRVSPGNIAEFILYVNLLIWPITSLGWVSSLIQRAAASQKRINEFLNTPSDIVSTSNITPEFNQGIEFKNVTFKYPDTGIVALKNFNLKINPGETIGILGKTGSGKSSLANLLLRIFDVNQGEIYFGNKNIKSLDLSALRSKIGYVPQEVFLFSDSIKNNIAFGLKQEQLNMKAIHNAAKLASIHDSIIEFKEGYETIVGERGITLSGGQKQRISIARAIIKNPDLLILDDCLSAVDTKTETILLTNLYDFMKHRTSIVISHRINSVKNANRIIVIDDGEIIESGSHQELIALNGAYAQITKIQSLE